MNDRNIFMRGTRVHLVVLEETDITTMTKWMNDQEINQFLRKGNYPLTYDDEKAFIESAYKSESRVVFGIYHIKDQKLIGNTGFHAINQVHQTASFGIVIGEKQYHGYGIGTEVTRMMLQYAFETRNLRSVTLSVLSNNPGARRCYEKCGFMLVGSYKKHVFKKGVWYDEHLMIAYNPLYQH